MVDLTKLEKIKTQEDLDKEYASTNAIQYLQSTDWYVVRKAETGVPVPDNVIIKRAEARQTIKDAE